MGLRRNCAARMNRLSVVPAALALDNVVVARTMSKAFGLAALRVGYAVGTAKTIGALAVAVSPKAFNPIASRVAQAALLHHAYYYAMVMTARREAARTVTVLQSRGFWALNTPGNFYLVYVGAAAGAVAQLARAGVQVRNRDDMPGLAGFVRVTAGSEGDSDAVLEAFCSIPLPAGPPPQTLYTPKGVITQLKTLVKKTLRVLDGARVQAWAQGGTMLGMARHRSALIPGGAIPTDDDADLAYARVDGVDPLAVLVDRFARAGLTLQRNRTDAYWQVGTNGQGTAISPVHIDVFSYSLVGSGGNVWYVLDDPRFREEDPARPRRTATPSTAPRSSSRSPRATGSTTWRSRCRPGASRCSAGPWARTACASCASGRRTASSRSRSGT